jgi:putative cell wall-binding protein
MNIDKEEIKVAASDLTDKVKELIHEGNVRRIILKNGEGQTIMEVPVTAGVLVAIVAPIITAIGAIAALAKEWSIVVERRDSENDEADAGE